MRKENINSRKAEAAPFAAEVPVLLQCHFEQLHRESGIAIEIIRERGYRSVTSKAELAGLGFSSNQQRVPGILIPLWGVDGKPVGYQFKPDIPRQNRKGKSVKYENPEGSSIRLDCPPRCHGILVNPNVPLWVTEGIKKADALASRGQCAIALTGVWGFKGKNPLGGTTLLADFDCIALKGREAIIAYDSDVSTKREVRQAIERLGEHLRRKGASLYNVRLPQNGAAKVGVDDYLAGGHTIDDLKALAESYQPDVSDDGVRARGGKVKDNPRYRARFDGLVDIVDRGGDLAYLIKEHGELRVVPSMDTGGQKYLPPPREQLPYSIPRWESVEKAYKDDTEETLFRDLIEDHKRYSQLPSESYYILLAAWDFSTYILEAVSYSGYIYLYAVPERGKTKTGQAMTYVAYRGIHQENLREADLFRASEDLGATLFLDVQNLSKKARREGSEDILLQRYEKGAKVRRVLYPEKGPFRDSHYYDIYGATVIASNEAISNIMESRSFPIDMPFAAKNFPKPMPETGLPLRERLVAWRAHRLGIQLPAPKQLTLGRLNDISTPLWQIIKLVSPSYLEAFEEFIRELSDKRREERGASIEGEVIKALMELEGEVEGGKLLVSVITDKVNEGRKDPHRVSSIYIGKVMRRLSFKLAGKHGEGRRYLYDRELIQRLAAEYGLADAYMPSSYLSQVSQVSPQIEEIPIKGDGRDRRDGYAEGIKPQKEKGENTEALFSDVLEV